MDQETLYTAAKWDILKMLEGKQLSPIEITKKTGGSMANVSQQLRLLEMAGLVKSERISNRDKGQPRILYSLAQDSCYVISTANSFVEKKRIPSTPSHQAMLKIWFLENQEVRTFAEKAFWKVEEYLPAMQALYLDQSCESPINLYVVAQEGLSFPHLQNIKHQDEQRQMTITQITAEQAEELKLYQLY